MIQDLADVDFDNRFESLEPREGDLLLHFQDRAGLLLPVATGEEEGAGWPDCDLRLPRLRDYPVPPSRAAYLFRIGADRYFLALDDEVSVPPGFSYERVALARHAVPTARVYALLVAYQLHNWYRDNRFCARCGHRTVLAPSSREIVCPSCGKVTYPKIQPGVICAVTHGDSLVLTKYAGRALSQYALVAGFTEVGETVEQTVRREVMEEVGLRVRNLRFYKSQPWPFSDTLLMGFWCEVDGDPAIVMDGTELKEATWFERNRIPSDRVDDAMSLTGEMVERFRRLGHRVFD